MYNEISTVPYTIQTNDTFYKISRFYNITLDDLIEVNPEINPDELQAGNIINLPLTSPHFSCPSISEIYTLKEGDTMYKLSQKYNIKLSTLIRSNPHINPDAPLPGQTICIPRPLNLYKNASYKVEFKYPIRWAKINDLFYEGLDGFFKISAINSDATLEQLCEKEAYHKLKPYGSHPNILKINAAETPACLIIPSSDQPNEMNGQSALILKYPNPILINNSEYTHMILWADSGHLRDIIETLSLSA